MSGHFLKLNLFIYFTYLLLLLFPLLLPFSGTVNCNMVILHIIVNIDLWLSIKHFYLSQSQLYNLEWFFLYPSICLQILQCYCFFTWAIFHWINVPLLHYPFFGWRKSRLFPNSRYYEKHCYKHRWVGVLGIWLGNVHEWCSWILRYADFHFSEKVPY